MKQFILISFGIVSVQANIACSHLEGWRIVVSQFFSEVLENWAASLLPAVELLGCRQSLIQ